MAGINLPTDMLPGVFSPRYFDSTKLFTEHFPPVEGRSLLEIGSGVGITSVMAAKQGASRVVGVDINPLAVANGQRNAQEHHAERIKFQLGDVYSPLESDEHDWRPE